MFIVQLTSVSIITIENIPYLPCAFFSTPNMPIFYARFLIITTNQKIRSLFAQMYSKPLFTIKRNEKMAVKPNKRRCIIISSKTIKFAYKNE